MKKIFFIFLLIYFKPALSFHENIIQISVPKSGTQMLFKCLSLLTNKTEAHFHMKNILDEFNLNSHEILVTHLPFYAENLQFLQAHNFKKFFLYRDPRDQVISLAFFMIREKQLWPHASEISFDELLLDIIAQGSSYSTPPSGGILPYYNIYLPWLKIPDVLSLRFEDLIGSKGGGSDEIQSQTIKKIAQHLGIELSNTKLIEIINSLFGGTYTFREGKIGAWKKYFKEYHKEVFKKVAGDLLVDLGYETNLNW